MFMKNPYHDRLNFYIEIALGLIILSISAGHYYFKVHYQRCTFFS